LLVFSQQYFSIRCQGKVVGDTPLEQVQEMK
jgi:hypothetical protein